MTRAEKITDIIRRLSEADKRGISDVVIDALHSLLVKA